MWERLLIWLPTFIWILGGTLLFPGIVMGVYHALKCVFGYSNDHLFGYFKGANYLKQYFNKGDAYVKKHVKEIKTPIPFLMRWMPENNVMGVLPCSLLGAGIGSLVKGLFYLGITRNYNILYLLVSGGTFGFFTAFSMTFGGQASLTALIFLLLTGGIPAIRGIGGILLNLAALVLFGTIISKGAIIVLPFEKTIDRKISSLMTSLLIPLRFRTIICQNCLRYTHPFKSQYENGRRSCEHCQGGVELTKSPGKVIFTFGDFPQTKPEDRIFVCFNPKLGSLRSEAEGKLFFRSQLDLDQRPRPVDVSEVYIDIQTCDPHLIERFITYILHDPPEHGLQSVQIFYRGELDELGENLKNALRNNFEMLKRLTGITPSFLRE